MNKNVETENSINQNKQIDYLKGYKKHRIHMFILIVILIMSIILLAYYVFLNFHDFYVDVNEIDAVCSYERDERVTFYVISISSQYDLSFFQYYAKDQQGNKTIYLKTVGKYSIGGNCKRFVEFDIDENVKKICIEDKKGNLKEIWNKEQGVLTSRVDLNL